MSGNIQNNPALPVYSESQRIQFLKEDLKYALSMKKISLCAVPILFGLGLFIATLFPPLGLAILIVGVGASLFGALYYDYKVSKIENEIRQLNPALNFVEMRQSRNQIPQPHPVWIPVGIPE